MSPANRVNHARRGSPQVVPAAGALVWRRRQGRLEVALVHRARYDDWSWPKGKLDPGETFAEAAVREVLEETGLAVRLGIPLPELVHGLANGSTKVVRYWAAEVVGGSGALDHEVDEVRWLTVENARRKLSYSRDHLPLDALVEAELTGRLETWPLLLVRHSHAQARSAYRGSDDARRPLSDRGKQRAKALVPVLSAWTPERVVSSSSARCVQTVKPFTNATGTPLRTKAALSEETFEVSPAKAGRQLVKAFERGLPVALCTHRPLLPALVATLSEHAPKGSPARRLLGRIKANGMDKGEVLVCQMLGSGANAQVISVERLRTPVLER